MCVCVCVCVCVYSSHTQLAHHHFVRVVVSVCVCVCVFVRACVTQLCSVFMSRADCALNESHSSLLGRRGERGSERREEERGQRERGKGMDESREERED